MTVRVVTTTYGRAALEALRAAVAEVKRDDPLAPVTVLVPNTIAGIVARRFLARGSGAHTNGIAGIYFSTIPRLADQLGGPRRYDAAELLTAATLTVREKASATVELGSVVLYLPQDLTAAQTTFAQALADQTGLRVIAGLTGNVSADQGVVATLAALEPTFLAPAGLGELPAGRVLAAADPNDEARRVVREVVQTLQSVPAHRVAVLYADASPYAPLLHQHLGAAGITTNGPGARPVNERAVSRLLLGLLETGCSGFQRADVLRALGTLGARDFTGERISLSDWERISGDSGVVGGEDWDWRLGTYIDAQTATLEDERRKSEPQGSTIALAEGNLETAIALQDFMIELQEWFAAIDGPRTWDDLAAWARGLLHSLVPRGDVARMPMEEQYAASAVERSLSILAARDGTGSAPSVKDLAGVLDLELRSALPRVGRFGEGILVAPVTQAIGLDLDVVYLVGTDQYRWPRAAGITQRGLLAAFATASQVVTSFSPAEQRGRAAPDLSSGLATGPNTRLDGVRQSAEVSRHRPAYSASGLEGTDPDGEGVLPDVEQPPPDLEVEADVAITTTRTDDDVASGAAKGMRDVELPARSKGRYGSAVGRAVHGALQIADLTTGADLEDAVSTQCVAEGVLDSTAKVASMVRSALDSEVVRRAAARQHWRESYVGMVEADGTVLEGFVDLMYREDDGSLVIIDYKIDDAPDAELASRMEYYAPQLNAYRSIVESALGRPTTAPVLLFARQSSARSIEVNGHQRPTS